MKIRDIKCGHLAVNDVGNIVYVGERDCIWIKGGAFGLTMNKREFTADYDDLGELKIEFEEVKKFVVKATVG